MLLLFANDTATDCQTLPINSFDPVICIFYLDKFVTQESNVACQFPPVSLPTHRSISLSVSSDITSYSASHNYWLHTCHTMVQSTLASTVVPLRPESDEIMRLFCIFYLTGKS